MSAMLLSYKRTVCIVAKMVGAFTSTGGIFETRAAGENSRCRCQNGSGAGAFLGPSISHMVAASIETNIYSYACNDSRVKMVELMPIWLYL